MYYRNTIIFLPCMLHAPLIRASSICGHYEVPTNDRNTPHFVILPILQFLFLNFKFSTCT